MNIIASALAVVVSCFLIVKRQVMALACCSVRFIVNLAREFMDKGCQKSAAALTYMTLFSLVPTMTVGYTLASLVPASDGLAEQLQGVIFEHFLPAAGFEVQAYLADFASQARKLTGFGIGMLAVTAFLMLTNIEKTFNSIWGVKVPRRGLSSFLLYWAVLSIGPILLIAGMAISTYVLSVKIFVAEYDQLGLAATFFRYLPVLMTTMAFTLLFAAVPNCRVPLRSALIGGFVTAICFELLKLGFASFVANSSFKLIYGAFAVVPVFLLWINLLWVTVLAGAVFVRALTEFTYISGGNRYSDLRAALLCLAVLRDKSQIGAVAKDWDFIATGMSVVHWQYLRDLLVRNKWLTTTASGGYVLCRDLQSVTLWHLASLVKMPIDEPLPDREHGIANEHWRPWLEAFFNHRETVAAMAKHEFGQTLEELFTCASEQLRVAANTEESSS